MKPMDAQLTSDQKAFARRAIAEVLLTLDDARASLARGEGRVITPENMQQCSATRRV
jgi:hypothetical protein